MELFGSDGKIIIENIDGTLVFSEEFYGSPYGAQPIENVDFKEFVRLMSEMEVTEEEKENEKAVRDEEQMH